LKCAQHSSSTPRNRRIWSRHARRT
jgi:hypothetical protein